jgi:hypothetical protein
MYYELLSQFSILPRKGTQKPTLYLIPMTSTVPSEARSLFYLTGDLQAITTKIILERLSLSKRFPGKM